MTEREMQIAASLRVEARRIADELVEEGKLTPEEAERRLATYEPFKRRLDS